MNNYYYDKERNEFRGPLDRMPPGKTPESIVDDIEAFSIYEPLWNEFNSYLLSTTSHPHTFTGESRVVPEGEIEWRYEVMAAKGRKIAKEWVLCKKEIYELANENNRRRVAAPKTPSIPAIDPAQQPHSPALQGELVDALIYTITEANANGDQYGEIKSKVAAFLSPAPPLTTDEEAGEWRSLPFDVKRLENNEWPITEENSKWMKPDEIEDAKKVWQEAENAIVFDGLHVSWDSCDCGDGYGCSHGSWPYEINTGIEGERIDFEDEGLYFEKNKKSISLGTKEGITLGDFFDLCKMVGINLTIRPNFSGSQASNQSDKQPDAYWLYDNWCGIWGKAHALNVSDFQKLMREQYFLTPKTQQP